VSFKVVWQGGTASVPVNSTDPTKGIFSGTYGYCKATEIADAAAGALAGEPELQGLGDGVGTLIGIVLGHWLFAALFTATSMIGFIALAGIIVRNSILLVDFVRHGGGTGQTLREVLLTAGAIRFKPILLTALSAMIGAATILTDPIFRCCSVWRHRRC
jgi:hypothetical protein